MKEPARRGEKTTSVSKELPPRLTSAILVHYGPWEPTGRALDSLRATGLPLEIVLVNNGSVDPLDAQRLAGPSAIVLSPGSNLGYGTACNLAARRASGGYLLFCNNDVELRPGSVEALLAALDRYPRAGAVGPRFLDEAGQGVASIGRAPTPRRILFENLFLPRLLPGLAFFQGHHTARIRHDRARDVETLLGALVLVRRSAFEEVGGFDERYFFYSEDSDLFQRLRRKGWRIRFEPASEAVHVGGLASRTVPQAQLDRWMHESLSLYARRHHGPRGERWTRGALHVGARLRWLLALLQPGAAGAARRHRYADILAMYRRNGPGDLSGR
jgi:N-acetylglucosaminyl-diphospho-decaprenol L-rhamnosyltransferase